MTAFRIAHISDPHLPPPPLPFRWSDVVSKRSLSRFAWRRKHHRHDPRVLDALTASIAGARVDHLVVTGDLVNFATPEEFAAARMWLEGLGDPAAVTVSPGNHDALAAAGAPKGFGPWKAWLGDGPDAAFPHLRVRGPVAIVNLSSAVPTAPHLATGALGRAQIEAARGLLAKAEGLYRVVLVHHPVAAGVVSRRKSLTDVDALRALLAETGCELVLHGHAHEALLTGVKGPGGATIPVLCVPSASTPTGMAHDQAARWNEIAVSRDGEGFKARVTAHAITADLGVETLGGYVLS
ncbi:metallophosphoesterase [Phenylobacterium sp.]|uniref:metallophosphoesterase family protein n=1 Tax=Phenylobacterium sp. TaxID=1871053 RepID=UPI0025D3CCA7|nr:metallophosphoesterase [Phenylobacterium sp.]MBX3484077.1 metallophosphoesterase [Phenylobacterium sp.]MCW5761448.1 metallophosphoesterase [Phenylobacterium sp.]